MAFSIFGYSWNRDRRDLKAKRRSSRRAKIGSETLECREQLSLTVTEFPLPPVPDPARPYRQLGSIVTGSDGNLWFLQGYSAERYSANDALSVGRMTPEGDFSEFPIPIPESWNFPSAHISSGADGNLWISTSSASDQTEGTSSIFRLTTNGELTQFPLPEGYQASSLVATGRGTVWFAFRRTESAETGGIGRMTPDGQVRLSMFKISKDGSFERSNLPESLTIGPNGGIWFAGSRFRNKDAFMKRNQFIGRTSEKGTKIRFYDTNIEVPTISTGPDGSIWFEKDWYKYSPYDYRQGVAKFDPHGKFHRFETLTSGYGLTGGPDGNLWTLGWSWDGSWESGNLPVINRVTSNGIVTVYPTDIQITEDLIDFYFATPYITGGPAESLWITDNTDDGRLVQISNLETFSGALDSRFESEWFDEIDMRYVSKFENFTLHAHPRFAGTAQPGSVVTVYASPWVEGQAQADPDAPRIRLGAAHANRRTGVWQMKSARGLQEGKYLIYAGLGREPLSAELMYPLSQNILSPDYELYGVSPLTVTRQRLLSNRKR